MGCGPSSIGDLETQLFKPVWSTEFGPAASSGYTLTILGDSLSDVGNELRRSKGILPTTGVYFEGRFSNGKVWNEYIMAQSGGKLTHVSNHAYGGAVACEENVSTLSKDKFVAEAANHIMPVPIKEQREAYLRLRPPAASRKNVMMVMIGSNDLMKIIQNKAAKPETDMAVGGSRLVEVILAEVAALAASGETSIVVVGVVSLQLTPKYSADPMKDSIGQLVIDVNTGLANAVASEQARLGASTKLNFLDFDTIFRASLAAAGVANMIVDRPCVTTTPPHMGAFYGWLAPHVKVAVAPGKGEGFFFFDQIHPTTYVHAQIAEQFNAKLVSWGLY